MGGKCCSNSEVDKYQIVSNASQLHDNQSEVQAINNKPVTK